MHIPQIPVLSPYEAQCFSKYFKCVDMLLAKRFSLGFLPNEEHITSILCELLDEHGSQLHPLTYSLSDLNNDLKQSCGLLQADVSISTSDYNKYEERHFTQSDLGIVLEYQDYIEPDYSFSRGVLIQAKKLFPYQNSDYNFSSKYESFKSDQHNRLDQLNQIYVKKGCGSECVKYLMYNPPLEIIPKYEQQKILHKEMVRDAITSEFYFTFGLHRYKELIESDKASILSLGCLFASIEDVHELAIQAAARASRTQKSLHEFNLGALVDAINVYESSLSWFFVFDLMMKGVGCSCKEFLDLVSSGRQSRIVGNLEVIPPKYSIKLKITAGVGEQR
ncbi:MAG: hypothetical protein EA343_14980 [Nodularia sp. (in: Bacteria)]|nr:MAG: hypothetical protein EA343_14980 [Nodularia sp. (in: cyanobacteria)]